MSHQTHLDAVLARIDADLDASLERLKTFLAIPSISTDPAYDGDVARAAEWLSADLASIGFDASVRPTTGHPMVMGQQGEGARHFLFYGHYDVQPVDPLELWTRPPFEPAIEETDGTRRIWGRGSSDDKGQLMTFVEACRAWVAETGSLPAKITVFFEGEEESGSPSLIPFLRENADDLRAELALICDTGLYGHETPAIATSLRGLLGEEIVLTGPRIDLHSGSYGGMAMNPIRVLTRILGGLHDGEGRVQVPGFYDDVVEPDPAVLEQWRGLNFDEEEFLGAVGLKDPAGETGRMGLERLWSRPTAEINGITGGYTGTGFKTVLPSEARAKVSFRLVANQDPYKLRESFRAWVRAQVPDDCTVEFLDHGAGPAASMDISHPAFEATRGALSQEWPAEATFIGMGGSIPVAGYFKTELGMDSMLTGFARDDDAIHSPNEKYDLECFHRGIRSWARILAAIA
ncbi:MAG: M20/M25/M40 family metallo-hydrolase [Pseudomonadota bacterium]